MVDPVDIGARVRQHLVGRARELELTLAAVAAGRDVLLEGPPGTSKTTMLQAITREWGIPLFFVEGNADLSPAKLIGHHNPARVLREDYSNDNFVPGPLTEALRSGGFLYIEELNRAPEDTVDTLLMAMSERSIEVPRVGKIAGQENFRVIASMNPFDNVGTTRLSQSVHDRLNRIVLNYQDAAAELAIVERRSSSDGAGSPELHAQIQADAVALTRATRRHRDIRQGASVRGAIDTALIAGQLALLRDLTGPSEPGYAELMFDAMGVGLSGRIHVDEAAETSPEEVLKEIWEDHFLLEPHAAAPG